MSKRYIVTEKQLTDFALANIGYARFKNTDDSIKWNEKIDQSFKECRAIEVPEEVTYFGSCDNFEGSELDCCFYWKEIPNHE